MTIPRSAADVLADHVSLEIECIDRMYLNVYQPKLMYESGIVGFFKHHRGFPFVSSALMDPMTKDFVASIHDFIATEGIPLVHFASGQRKDDVAQQYLANHSGEEGVLFDDSPPPTGLRPAHRGKDRRLGPQVAPPLAPSLHRGGPPGRLPI